MAMNLSTIDATIGHNLQSFLRTLTSRLFHRGDSISRVDGSAAVVDSEDLQELELLGESLIIDKEKLIEGEITIRKEVITEMQMIQVPVTREELVIERRSADGSCQEISRGQQQLRIPISKERVVVSKEPVLNEVVKIRRRTIGENKVVSTNVRREELRVTREGKVRDVDIRDDQAA